MTRVSVISVFYNRAKYVVPSVESLLAQDHDDLEIILVDDESTDDTLAELRRFAGDPRVRIIAQPNCGFTRSMNNAIRASSGQYIAVHGSGDVSLPQRISAQARVLDERPDVGVVGCWVENDDDSGTSADVMKPPNGLDFARTMLSRTLFTHGEAMYRRSTFDQVGGYREFFEYAQDRDLWLRMSEHCDYFIVPAPLYRRFKLPGGVATNADKLLLQMYLSDFAVQCARARRAGSPDPVTRFGHMAAFLRQPSENFGRRAAWQGVKFLIADQPGVAAPVLKRSASESRSLQSRLIGLLCATYGMPVVWKQFSRPLLSRRLKRFRQA